MHPSWFQSLKYYTGIISLGVLLGLGLQFAQAWSNPTQSAPNGNVAGPVNTGLLTQIKQGSLGLLGNLSAGLVQLTTVVTAGTNCPSNGLVGRDTTGMILVCQTGIWKALAVSGGGGITSVQQFLETYAGRTLTFSQNIDGTTINATVVVEPDKARITASSFSSPHAASSSTGCQVTPTQHNCTVTYPDYHHWVQLGISTTQIWVHGTYMGSQLDSHDGTLGVLTTDMLNAGTNSN